MEQEQKGQIKVSIVCCTLNHSNFIKRAIDGFLNQKTEFAYEILIYDLGSKDGTKKILMDYQRKYPDIIRIFLENRGKDSKVKGFFSIVRSLHVKGKYIAFSEGCDEWIYDQKIQKQYEKMEKNLNVSLSVHNEIKYSSQMNTTKKSIQNIETGIIDIEKFFIQDIPISSFFFRSEDMLEVPEFIYQSSIQEMALKLYFACIGKIYYSNGLWSICNLQDEDYLDNKMKDLKFIKEYIFLLDDFNNYSKKQYNWYFYKKIQQMCTQAINLSGQIFYKKQGLLKAVNEIKQETNHLFDDILDKIYDNYLFYCIDGLDSISRRFIESCKKENGKLYLYGTGEYAKLFAEKWNRLEISYEGFAVTDGHKEINIFMEHDVVEISKLDKNSYIYLSLNNKHTQEVLHILKNYNFNNILYFTEHEIVNSNII